jgi:hypothetical protein
MFGISKGESVFYRDGGHTESIHPLQTLRTDKKLIISITDIKSKKSRIKHDNFEA